MKSKSKKGNSPAELQAALDASKSDAFRPTPSVITLTNMDSAEAAVVFSRVGRLGTFGPMINSEIEGLSAIWNKPMPGFFSSGEFGKPGEGCAEFQGTTVHWVALKEK